MPENFDKQTEADKIRLEAANVMNSDGAQQQQAVQALRTDWLSLTQQQRNDVGFELRDEMKNPAQWVMDTMQGEPDANVQTDADGNVTGLTFGGAPPKGKLGNLQLKNDGEMTGTKLGPLWGAIFGLGDTTVKL